VEDCDFAVKQGDRAIIFLQGVDQAVIQRVHLRGSQPYIDLVDNCQTLVVRDMPQDTLVRVKAASGAHNAPIATHEVPAGADVTFRRQASGGMLVVTGTVL